MRNRLGVSAQRPMIELDERLWLEAEDIVHKVCLFLDWFKRTLESPFESNRKTNDSNEEI